MRDEAVSGTKVPGESTGGTERAAVIARNALVLICFDSGLEVVMKTRNEPKRTRARTKLRRRFWPGNTEGVMLLRLLYVRERAERQEAKCNAGRCGRDRTSHLID